MQTYEGGCHCGAVRYKIETTIERVIICNCSICQMKGILHHFVPKERFHLISGMDALTDYQFNTRIAHHYFCKTCGIHSYYIPRSHPDQIDINVRCVRGINLKALPVVHFDGKNWEQAIAKLKNYPPPELDRSVNGARRS